jgi:hypothetical protein
LQERTREMIIRHGAIPGLVKLLCNNAIPEAQEAAAKGVSPPYFPSKVVVAGAATSIVCLPV